MLDLNSENCSESYLSLRRQPPRLSCLGVARRMGTGLLLMMLLIIGGFSHAASIWTVRTQPARLVNGSPVLFQVKPPAKLEALTGTWLGHQIIFSYNSSTKTWFALAGLGFETAPGKYTLDLKGERSKGNGNV